MTKKKVISIKWTVAVIVIAECNGVVIDDLVTAIAQVVKMVMMMLINQVEMLRRGRWRSAEETAFTVFLFNLFLCRSTVSLVVRFLINLFAVTTIVV